MDHSGHLAGGHNWWTPASQTMGGLSPSSSMGSGGQRLLGETQGIAFRSPLDARRAAKGQLSQAEWPDGYLGNIIDRRQDKLLKAVSARSEPSYQRGVHRGSKIDEKEYFWPAEDAVGPDDGLRRKAQIMDNDGLLVMVQKRQAPKGVPTTILVNDGKTPPQPNGDPGGMTSAVIQDPLQQIHFHRMTPRYRTGP
jgi:hypothetical protein